MSDESLQLQIRALRLEDEPRVLELFKIVFGNPMTPEQWRWQFPGNPFSRPVVYLAETPEGRLVGHYSLIPLPFLKRGKSALAALSVQSMIHPEFQKRGILKRLAAAAEAQLDADGIGTGVTFLNDNSLHAYTQHFGWTELDGPNFIYFTVLDCRGPAAKLLRSASLGRLAGWVGNPLVRLVFGHRPSLQSGAAADSLRFRAVERFDERVDVLWRAFSRELGQCVDRTARYLNWRLADKPDEYSLWVCEEGSELLGLVVTKTERKFGLFFGYVVELMFDPSRPELGQRLVAHALASLREQGCSMATALSAGSPRIERVLRAGGFWRLPRKAMPHGIHFCFKDREGSGESEGWYLSWVDHDVV